MPALRNKRHELFCAGLASGLSATKAYIKAGYSEKGADVSASRLNRKAKVKARIAELSGILADRTVRTLELTPVEIEIADRNKRVSSLQELLQRHQQLIDSRALACKDKKNLAPGAETGLLVQNFKSLGSGSSMRIVPEWEYDAAVPKEMRALMQQAAQELGQWTEKRELTETKPTSVEYKWVPPDPEPPKEVKPEPDPLKAAEDEDDGLPVKSLQ